MVSGDHFFFKKVSKISASFSPIRYLLGLSNNRKYVRVNAFNTIA